MVLLLQTFYNRIFLKMLTNTNTKTLYRLKMLTYSLQSLLVQRNFLSTRGQGNIYGRILGSKLAAGHNWFLSMEIFIISNLSKG